MSNLYRAQFAYPAKGFKEETFHYSFDKTNVAALGNAIAGAALVSDIYLQLQNDYEFTARGIKIQSGTAASQLYLWLKDPFDNYLSQTYVPLSLYATGSGSQVCGSFIIPLNPEIVCPAGGVFVAYLYNPTAAPVNPAAFTFFGVKRCAIGRAA